MHVASKGMLSNSERVHQNKMIHAFIYMYSCSCASATHDAPGSSKSTQEARVAQGTPLRFFFALQTSHVHQQLIHMLKHESIVLITCTH